MASPSTFSPNKSTCQTSYPDIFDLKWTKKVSHYLQVTPARLKGTQSSCGGRRRGGENPNPENADAVVAAALAAQEAEEVVTKTWNLRPRNPCKPVRNPSRDATGAAWAQNNRKPGVGRSRPARVPQSKKPPEPSMEISLTLTKEEIEEDFLRMTGKKPARRPKMRLKNVQKQLDILTPGQLYLDDISAHGSQQAKLNKGSD
ncbi:hypothetical protein ACLB2K_073879 [Fragaria x ananassa]